MVDALVRDDPLRPSFSHCLSASGHRIRESRCAAPTLRETEAFRDGNRVQAGFFRFWNRGASAFDGSPRMPVRAIASTDNAGEIGGAL
jgi:hypothetical protein